MNFHPITTLASPSLASPIFDAWFDSIESQSSSFAASVVPTLETTTVTEVVLGNHRTGKNTVKGPPTFVTSTLPPGGVAEGISCKECETREKRAYTRQCSMHYPYQRDDASQAEQKNCLFRGLCGSCKGPCKDDKAFKDKYGCQDQ